LRGVLLWTHLASETKHIDELDALKHDLLKLLYSKKSSIGRLELRKKKFQEIKSEIEFKVNNLVFRSALAESLTQHLVNMGYEPLENFSSDSDQPMFQAALRIPGGERVRVAIQRNNAIAFQVLHETDVQGGVMSKEQFDFFRQQEKKWCQDFQDLIRRLVKEGFSFNIMLERLVPDASIQVVALETAEEILLEEGEEEEMGSVRKEKSKRRTLHGPPAKRRRK